MTGLQELLLQIEEKLAARDREITILRRDLHREEAVSTVLYELARRVKNLIERESQAAQENTSGQDQ